MKTFGSGEEGGTSYNIDGQVIDPFIYIGQGVSSYTTPTAPLIDASGDINHFSGFSDTFRAYYNQSWCRSLVEVVTNPVPNYFALLVQIVSTFHLMETHQLVRR